MIDFFGSDVKQASLTTFLVHVQDNPSRNVSKVPRSSPIRSRGKSRIQSVDWVTLWQATRAWRPRPETPSVSETVFSIRRNPSVESSLQHPPQLRQRGWPVHPKSPALLRRPSRNVLAIPPLLDPITARSFPTVSSRSPPITATIVRPPGRGTSAPGSAVRRVPVSPHRRQPSDADATESELFVSRVACRRAHSHRSDRLHAWGRMRSRRLDSPRDEEGSCFLARRPLFWI